MTSLEMARGLVSSHISHVEGNVRGAGHTAWHPRAVFQRGMKEIAPALGICGQCALLVVWQNAAFGPISL